MRNKSKGIGLDKPMAMPRMSAEDKKYRAEEDLRTLKRAEEIRADPQRVKLAKQTANQEIKALARITK